ncbi:MAG: EamA-like transporter family protein [Anaerolineae bacterium]|nr:DMT family transporter [Anaerolineales bacterium]MCQ3972366.1 EamA-like transporter family protein [Anaerolineae bacterium]
MLEIVLTILIGLLGGVSVGLQGPIAGAMSQRVGSSASSFIVHISGAILSGLLLAARGGETIQNWRGLPWYMLGSGVFGLILYLTLTHTLPRLGATTAVTLIIVGQLVMGMLIDQFGWFGVEVRPIDGWRLAAVVLLLAGGYLMVR